MLKKYGDKPVSEINKEVREGNLNEWVTRCDCTGNIVGAMRTEKTDWYLWTVKDAVVEKRLQGSGIGTAMLKDCVKKAVKDGAKVLTADITYDNIKSKKMVKKLGFKPVTRFCWAKGKKPADIVHYVLYPPVGTKCPHP